MVGFKSCSGGSLRAAEGGRDLGSVLCRTPARDPTSIISLGGNSSRSLRPSIFCFCIAVPVLPPSLASFFLYRNLIISPTSPHSSTRSRDQRSELNEFASASHSNSIFIPVVLEDNGCTLNIHIYQWSCPQTT